MSQKDRDMKHARQLMKAHDIGVLTPTFAFDIKDLPRDPVIQDIKRRLLMASELVALREEDLAAIVKVFASAAIDGEASELIAQYREDDHMLSVYQAEYQIYKYVLGLLEEEAASTSIPASHVIIPLTKPGVESPAAFLVEEGHIKRGGMGEAPKTKKPDIKPTSQKGSAEPTLVAEGGGLTVYQIEDAEGESLGLISSTLCCNNMEGMVALWVQSEPEDLGNIDLLCEYIANFALSVNSSRIYAESVSTNPNPKAAEHMLLRFPQLFSELTPSEIEEAVIFGEDMLDVIVMETLEGKAFPLLTDWAQKNNIPYIEDVAEAVTAYIITFADLPANSSDNYVRALALVAQRHPTHSQICLRDYPA